MDLWGGTIRIYVYVRGCAYIHTHTCTQSYLCLPYTANSKRAKPGSGEPDIERGPGEKPPVGLFETMPGMAGLDPGMASCPHGVNLNRKNFTIIMIPILLTLLLLMI